MNTSGLVLFLISAGSVGFETALTRYFAVSKWSEYGYWVISIVMAGLALSGVVVALGQGWLIRRRGALLAWLPVALVVAAAAGYWLVTLNPFNPLQLQNQATWQPQLGYIGLYYLELLPFFFLAGLYISLSFVLNPDRAPLVYACDLTGAGAGALLVLGLMTVVHPFTLVPALLVPLAGAALIGARRAVVVAAVLSLMAGEGLLLADGHAAYNDFKAIYAPLHVPDGRVLATRHAPRGDYTLMEDFTERVDTDISNDAGLLGVPGPPTAYGVYKDGNRIAALPRPGLIDTRYAPATLAALAYVLRSHARVLLVGASGGFRIGEALRLGAAQVTALEPDPVLRAAERRGWSGSAPADPHGAVLDGNPVAVARSGSRYDVIDLSGDFLDEAEANPHAFTAEAIRSYVEALAPGGVVSIPVSIREFPAYAVRMLATVRAALRAAGMADPARLVLVIRSAWNVRILVRPSPWKADEIALARRWADARSFDVSWFPGMDRARPTAVYNDLPAVSFERGEVDARMDGPSDALADEAGPVLRGLPTRSGASFNLAPITEARPFYYDVLRLDHLPLILKRIDILPQAEIGPLVNVAVLLQATLLAALVLAVPLLARRGRAGVGMVRPMAYFAALGLGFLFIEIAAIEKAAFLLNDRATAFALVLTAMLVFSGLGSLLATGRRPRLRLIGAVGLIMLWCAAMALWGDRLIMGAAGWPQAGRIGAVILAVAPVSLALGLPFPLGLAEAARQGPFLLPWAWALNGAFSVVATPLANLVALSWGLDRVLFAALLLYALCIVVFPARKLPA